MFTNLIPDMKREIAVLLTYADLGNLSKVSKTVHSDLIPEMANRKCKYKNRPPSKTLENGTKIWTNSNGLLHQVDGPAVIHPNGDQEWCRNGKLDREDGPAVILSEGDQFWIRENRLHREDGPAVILERDNGNRYKYLRTRHMDDPIDMATVQLKGNDGDQRWFTHGKLNRLNDLPAVINKGRQEWWVDDKRHRIGNPAVICEYDVIYEYEGEDNYYEEWWVKGHLNREDGPAITGGGNQPVWCCAHHIFFWGEGFVQFMQNEFCPDIYKKYEDNDNDEDVYDEVVNLATGEVWSHSDTWRLLTPTVYDNGILKGNNALRIL